MLFVVTFGCTTHLCSMIFAEIFAFTNSFAEDVSFGCWRRWWNESFGWLSISTSTRYEKWWRFEIQTTKTYVDRKYHRRSRLYREHWSIGISGKDILYHFFDHHHHYWRNCYQRYLERMVLKVYRRHTNSPRGFFGSGHSRDRWPAWLLRRKRCITVQKFNVRRNAPVVAV